MRIGPSSKIHEMAEMRAGALGQYAQGNQPCHHLAYIPALLGARGVTQTTVRTLLQRAYGPDFYAGDEDTGEQGAWWGPQKIR